MTQYRCITCKASVDDINYRFCSGLCQTTYIIVIEKNSIMKHSFIPSQLNKTLCAKCNRDIFAHTKNAQCESCPKKGKCEVIENVLMCEDCQEQHLSSRRNEIEYKLQDAKQVIEQSRQIDSAIRYNGDIFNAKTIAFADIKKAIDNDDSIPAEEKSITFQKVLVERYHTLKEKIFKIDNEKHEMVVEGLAIGKTLRDLGNALREEIREQIKQLDSSYVPVKPKLVTTKIKKEKKTPFDRIVESVAVAKGLSIEDAKKLVTQMGLK